MSKEDTTQNENARPEASKEDKQPPKAPVYPPLSPGYMALLKWLALIFVAAVVWAVFNSGYS